MFNFDCQTTEYIVHSASDPALDLDKSDIDGYRLTLDKNLLAVKEGLVLSEFVLRPVTVKQKVDLTSFAIASKDGDFEKTFEYAMRSLEYSLVRIDCHDVKTRDDIYMMGIDLIFEISSYVMEVGQLPLAVRQRCGGSQ